MERYTASYGKIKNSFVFQNISGNDDISKYYGLFCILKNIIQRGNPTKPSVYLTTILGELDLSKCEPLKLISPEAPNWRRKIKGNDENNDFPAEIFLNELIPKYLGEYSFIQQLILPEALISDLVLDVNNEFISQQVDFYLPQAKLVIEIDGEQHNEKLQKQKDDRRDLFLKKHGILTIRITAKSVKNEDKELSEKIQNIKGILEKCKVIKEYFDIFNGIVLNLNEDKRIEYDMVIRFQILLLVLLQKNIINLKDQYWDFSIVDAEESVVKLFQIASEDLFLWLEHLCKLRKLIFRKPKMRFENLNTKISLNSLVIDFSMKKRWTDENEEDKNIIFIRNDYYDNKDYFCASTTDSIKYKIIVEGKESDLPSLYFILKNIFDYEEFNDGQLPILINTLTRLDTIGILPTGSGKSLCYQFASILQPCINFVVCPILALMYDQKQNLDEFGFTRTSYITSDKSGSEKEQILKEFGNGKYLLIWISPERFQSQKFRDALGKINYNRNFALAVIDEVHCLSEWGHDFRTSYLTLVKTIKHYCPETRLLGLTATASKFVLEDLKKEFNIDSSNIKSLTSMDRKELNFYLVKVYKHSKYEELEEVLKVINKKHGGEVFVPKGKDSICGLVFTVNKGGKNGCSQIANNLSNSFQIQAKAYHGDLGNMKMLVQNGYKDNEFNLLVATKAFGMGVNKKNIRYTIHYGLPWSVEAFYQEAGRAGRDIDKSKQSDCYIIYEAEACSPNIINKIFELDIEMKEIDRLSQQLRKDLSSIMFLWKLNNLGLERDLKVMRWVMTDLYRRKSDILSCNEEYKKPEVEKAIYKLSLLGMLDDWTIEDWGEESAIFRVYQKPYSEDSVRMEFFKYIKRYDPDFSESDTTGRYTKYLNILNDDSLKLYTRYMKALLQWGYDNIVYTRRQAIKNMMELCDNYTDSDTFRKYIDNYFRFSDSTIVLDNIAYSPNDSSLWFEIFYSHIKVDENKTQPVPITAAGSEALLASLQRYLESYRFNTGLNFISGIVRLLCNKFTDSDGLERLEDAFNAIETNQQENIDYIIEQSLDILKNADLKNKNIFSQVLMKRYPHKAKQTYKALQDTSSLTVALNQSAKKLQKYKETIQW